jgi:hypothetical protein
MCGGFERRDPERWRRARTYEKGVHEINGRLVQSVSMEELEEKVRRVLEFREPKSLD